MALWQAEALKAALKETSAAAAQREKADGAALANARTEAAVRQYELESAQAALGAALRERDAALAAGEAQVRAPLAGAAMAFEAHTALTAGWVFVQGWVPVRPQFRAVQLRPSVFVLFHIQ